MTTTHTGLRIEDRPGDVKAIVTNDGKLLTLHGLEEIVRAVNSHDDLVAALEAWVDAFGWDEGPNSMQALRDSSRAALAKAQGETK